MKKYINYISKDTNLKNKLISNQSGGLNCADPNEVINCFKFSDHMPVFKTININNYPINVASYNVLFDKWLTYNIHSSLNKNDFGGHITKYFKHLANMDTTLRRYGVIFTIFELFRHYKVDVIGIQEFNPVFINDLNIIPDIGIIKPSDINGYNSNEEINLLNSGSNDWQIVIYNKHKLTLGNGSHLSYYYEKPLKFDPYGITKRLPKINKRIMNIDFLINDTQETFRFINTHVLFNAIDDLVTYVKGIK